jgi:hypothetical protein
MFSVKKKDKGKPFCGEKQMKRLSLSDTFANFSNVFVIPKYAPFMVSAQGWADKKYTLILYIYSFFGKKCIK